MIVRMKVLIVIVPLGVSELLRHDVCVLYVGNLKTKAQNIDRLFLYTTA
jgi:methyl coenzyme M reductase subunit C